MKNRFCKKISINLTSLVALNWYRSFATSSIRSISLRVFLDFMTRTIAASMASSLFSTSLSAEFNPYFPLENEWINQWRIIMLSINSYLCWSSPCSKQKEPRISSNRLGQTRNLAKTSLPFSQWACIAVCSLFIQQPSSNLSQSQSNYQRFYQFQAEILWEADLPSDFTQRKPVLISLQQEKQGSLVHW